MVPGSIKGRAQVSLPHPPSKMSFGSDHYLSSSYRKIFGDPPRSTSRLGGSPASSRTTISSGYRSQSVSRSNVSSAPAYRRSGRQGGYYSGENLDITQTSALNNEYKIIRTNEKEQMQGLNDRFAMFIEKVHNLEQQNKVLETELVALRQRQSEPSRLGELYQQELKDLRAQLEDVNAEKAQLILERDSLEDDLQKLKGKYEDEIRMREDTEYALKTHKKDVDDATLARLDLEKKVESLLDEISFMRKIHEEEITELMAMLQASQVSVEMELSKPDGPDLTSALKDIRSQYESLAAQNLQSADVWYKSKFANLSEQASRSSEVIRASREEINDYRRQLQSKTIEIESLRGTNESLERQIQEMEERQLAEMAGMQDTINQLENELRNTKGEMARHLREYQDLLNVKMALDIEIAAYRKLLEGEETRFSTTGMSILPPPNPPQSYSYQSRIHTSSSKVTPAASRKDEADSATKTFSKTSTHKGETYEEIIEETVVATKKIERPEQNEGVNGKP